MVEVALCAYCGGEFTRRRSDHRFCSPQHRKLGERKPHDPAPPDAEQIERLFAEDRDPDARVEPTDWHPTAYLAFAALDTHDTVAKRRRWYLELLDRGLL